MKNWLQINKRNTQEKNLEKKLSLLKIKKSKIKTQSAIEWEWKSIELKQRIHKLNRKQEKWAIRKDVMIILKAKRGSDQIVDAIYFVLQ